MSQESLPSLSLSLSLEPTLEFTDDEKCALDLEVAYAYHHHHSPILQRAGAVIMTPEETQGKTDSQVFRDMVARSKL